MSLVVLGLALAPIPAAMAGPPGITLHVRVVPERVRLHGVFKVRAFGVSSDIAGLEVFLNKTHGCASTATEDGAIAGDHVAFSHQVEGPFSRFKRFEARAHGAHRVCAYVTGPSGTASAQTVYRVVG